MWIPLFLVLLSFAQSFPENAADRGVEVSEVPIFQRKNVWRFVYSPNGKKLVCADVRGRLVVYETETGEEIARLEGHPGHLRRLVYSPDGQTIAADGDDRAVYLWDAATAKLIRKIGGVPILRETPRLGGENQRVWGFAYSPDGRTLATGGSDGSVYLWNTATEKMIAHLTRRTEHPVTVTVVGFHPMARRW